MSRARKDPDRCKVFDDETGMRCIERGVDSTGMCPRHQALHQSTGPNTPEGKATSSKNSVRNGLYAEKWLFPEQREMLVESEHKRGDLYGLMDWHRMRLWWTQRRIYQIESGEIDGMEDTEVQVEQTGARPPVDAQGKPTGGDPVGGSMKFRRVQKRTTLIDLYLLADRITRTIMHLEKQVFEQGLQGGGPSNPIETAQQIKGALRAMFAQTHGRANGTGNDAEQGPYWQRAGVNTIQPHENRDEGSNRIGKE